MKLHETASEDVKQLFAEHTAIYNKLEKSGKLTPEERYALHG